MSEWPAADQSCARGNSAPEKAARFHRVWSIGRVPYLGSSIGQSNYCSENASFN